MGNNITINWKEQLKHQFLLLETQSIHDVLGEIDIFQYIPDEKIKIFSKITTLSNKDYFIEKTKLKHPNLLRALAIDDAEQKNQNGDKLYQIYYDYPGICTLEKISKAKKNAFLESSIWNIMFQVVDCAEYLQTHYKSFGNLNPNTIYVLDDGIKFLDTNHLFSIYSSYEQAQQNKIAILSPEQINELSRNYQKSTVNQFKSDVFCFGIVILCLISKSDFTLFYLQNNDINKDQIFQKLQYLKSNYSEMLYGLVQKMLLENPDERQSWIDIKKFIDPFKIMSAKELPFYQDIKLCPQITKPVPQFFSPQQPIQLKQQFYESQNLNPPYQTINSARLPPTQISQQIPIVNRTKIPSNLPIQSQQKPVIHTTQVVQSQQLLIPAANYQTNPIPNYQQNRQINQNSINKPISKINDDLLPYKPLSLPPQSVPPFSQTATLSQQPNGTTSSFNYKIK